ncbi:MAG: 16S rRNA (uracil(1498)-N(3))-methyltransferase [candidate division Zixibacteria bacterium]|nr:16S rRNA (uracil(1498)-N(3))-methyltransferase [candidate division Zixibacteria bacterium]
MLPPIFFAPAEDLERETIALPPDEAKHAVQVMRLTTGAMVVVVDGLGVAVRGEIVRIGKGVVEIRPHQTVRDFGEPLVRVTLAAGLSTGGKFDAIVQKGTELGIKRFVPLLSGKALAKADDARRAANRVKRLEKVALAAIKQCRRSFRPEIALPMTVSDFLKQHDTDTPGLIFHPSESAGRFSSIRLPESPRRLSVMIGPEAGFSESEVAAAAAVGFHIVSLGRRILRAETAGPVICALVMDRLGELS